MGRRDVRVGRCGVGPAEAKRPSQCCSNFCPGDVPVRLECPVRVTNEERLMIYRSRRGSWLGSWRRRRSWCRRSWRRTRLRRSSLHRNRNGSAIERNLGLCQCSAIQYRACLHDNLFCAQYSSIERRVCPKSCTGKAADLPEDIRGLGSTCEHYLNTASDITSRGNIEISRYLKYPNIVCTTREGDVSVYQNTGTPFVDARSECQPTNISSAQFSKRSRGCHSGGVGVRGIHVAYSYAHVNWSRRIIVGCIYISSH